MLTDTCKHYISDVDQIFERSASGVPEPGVRIVRVGGKRVDASRKDQPAPFRRVGLALVRHAAMHDDGRTVQRLFEEALVGLELE
jgi:hypothetical protein